MNTTTNEIMMVLVGHDEAAFSAWADHVAAGLPALAAQAGLQVVLAVQYVDGDAKDGTRITGGTLAERDELRDVLAELWEGFCASYDEHRSYDD